MKSKRTWVLGIKIQQENVRSNQAEELLAINLKQKAELLEEANRNFIQFNCQMRLKISGNQRD